MEVSLRRTVSQSCLSVSRPSYLLPRLVPTITRRQKSTANRTKRALNIPPHPSFITSTGEGDHIIFNPPSSAPSVFHTPLKFLPKTDPRRRAILPSLLLSASPASPSVPATTIEPGKLPPVLDPANEARLARRKRHNLTAEDVAEMRRLRAADPMANSVAALAARFDCTTTFVLMCCRAPKEHKERVKAELERAKARWGPVRTQAREDRARRKEMVFRGEI